MWSVPPSIQWVEGSAAPAEKTLPGLGWTWKLGWAQPSTFLRRGDSAARRTTAPLCRSMIMQMESNLDNIIEN